MPTKKLCIFLIFLFSSFMAMSQAKKIVYPKAKIRLGAGVAFTDFYGKQPFALNACRNNCTLLSQKAKPNFTLGGQFSFLVKKRHYLGLGYRWHGMNIQQQFSESNNNIYKENSKVVYHNFYLTHQFQINPNKKYLWWHNGIGLDKTTATEFLKPWAVFYRTGISFQLKYTKDRGIVTHPFFQIGLSPYSKNQNGTTAVMRPIMVGLTFDIPYDFY